MNVFTFDDKFFFDRQPHDECWYAYTHPASKPFAHGHFSVATCEFERDPQDGRVLSEAEKADIERILKANKASMGLDQFDAHTVLPSHYKLINGRSNRFADFIDRLKWMARCDPTFSIAFETLTRREPAYRLTREFVSRVFDQMQFVTPEEVAGWLHEVTEDTWIYDHDPQPGETYEDFYRLQERKLTVPDPIKLHVTQNHKLYSIDGLPRLYLLEEQKEFAGSQWRESRYYVDIGSAFSPAPLSNAYIL